jgi:uncharacterized protein (TIGR02145 family)
VPYNLEFIKYLGIDINGNVWITIKDIGIKRLLMRDNDALIPFTNISDISDITIDHVEPIIDVLKKTSHPTVKKIYDKYFLLFISPLLKAHKSSYISKNTYENHETSLNPLANNNCLILDAAIIANAMSLELLEFNHNSGKGKKSIVNIQNNNSGKGASRIVMGHEVIDLGLKKSPKWATCNVGAINPEDYGNLYDWSSVGKASASWGGKWRMPTKKEVEDLAGKCRWLHDKVNGVDGMRVIGPNGNSIFLPFAGYSQKRNKYFVNECGNYWSGTDNDKYASYLDFSSNHRKVNDILQNYDFSVRLVMD